ncbi:MAG: O-antigen ligase family protein [Hyphomicrobiaceae bacterium]|nr:MAG: O-antigen ligase family protein [Hyphomicrobiaceae bacterium]
MNEAPATFADSHERMLLATAAWTACGILVFAIAPMTAVALLPLSVAAPVTWAWARQGRLRLQRPSAAILGLMLAALYLLLNATWSLSPAAAYSSVAMLFTSIAAAHITSSALQDSENALLRTVGLAACAGFIVGSAAVCFEVLNGQWTRAMLAPYVHGLAADLNRTETVNGAVILFPSYLLNRSITALALLFWPAVLLIKLVSASRRQKGLLLAGLLPVLVAIFRSSHATSKMAFIAGAAVYALFWISPLLGRRAVIAGWIAAIFLVVPAASFAYSKGLHLAEWLPASARHRVVIWGHASAQIGEAPILGIGIASGRALHDPHDPQPKYEPGTTFRTSALHTHNGYLQTWYETGAVGALLLLGVGILLWRSLAAADERAQPYLYAAFTSCAVMAGSSFSLWAPWFIAAIGFTAVVAVLGWTLHERAAG